jgi:acyl-coenzyme A synthetase/AMP-(fatty) acid ligase/thioesterase domain-containing protein
MKDYPNIWTLLCERAESYNKRPVLWSSERSLDHAELLHRVRRAALSVAHSTSKPVVAVLAPDPLSGIVGMLGVMAAGRAFWIANPALLQQVSNKVVEQVDVWRPPAFDDQEPLSLPERRPQSNVATAGSGEHGPLSADSSGPSNPQAKSAEELCCWTTSSASSAALPKLTRHSYHSIYEETWRQVRQHNIGPRDRLDMVFSPTFSASLSAVFPALFAGATLHLFPADRALAGLVDFWQDQGITMTTLLPSVFRAVLSPNRKRSRLPLRFICLGGEAVSQDDVRLFRQCFTGRVKLQLALASSEARAVAECVVWADEVLGDNFEIAYRAVDGKTLSVIGPDGQPSPPGCPGRLAVQSSVIGEGYVGEEEGFQALAGGERRFLSDDWACCLPDGSLRLLPHPQSMSRKIKVRGTFVDLDWVEQRLRSLPDVGEVYVVPADSPSELLCFVESSRPPAEVRRAMAQATGLGSFHLRVFAQGLPRLESGKLDRRALQALGVRRGHDASATSLHEIWASLFPLQVDFAGKDLFDDLGADSLLVLQLLQLINARFALDLEPSFVLFYSGFDQQQKWLEKGSFFELKALSPSGGTDRPRLLVMPHVNGRHVHYRHLVQRLQSTYQVFMLCYPTKERGEFLSPAEIARRCATFLRDQAEPFDLLLGYSFSGYLAYTTAHYLGFKGTVILIDTPLYRRRPWWSRLGSDLRLIKKGLTEKGLTLSTLLRYALQYRRRVREVYLKPAAPLSVVDTGRGIDDHYYSFFAPVSRAGLVIERTSFPLGLFIATDQSFFDQDILADYHWEDYNDALLFKLILPADHGSILDPEAVEKIVARLSVRCPESC